MGWSEATDPATTEAVEAARDSQPPGAGAAVCCCPPAQTPRPADDHLCRRTAPERGHRPEETDLDSQRQMIRVEQGKGRKDRYTILSPTAGGAASLLENVSAYLLSVFRQRSPSAHGLQCRPENLLCSQTESRHPEGHGYPHAAPLLCHSLLEAGVDLPTIQMLMGHTSILTTMRYLQVRRQHLDAHASQFDLLRLPDKLPKR